MTKINLKDMTPELFLDVAKRYADELKDNNNITQLRKFYNELCKFDDRLAMAGDARDEQFARIQPYLCMLVPKAVYAKSRKHVDDNFVRMITECVRQTENTQILQNFRLFFEAVIAYMPKK